MKTFVIAELGSSWLFSKQPEQNFKHALKLMGIAARAGAMACKMQWVSDPLAMAKRRKIEGNPYQHLSWPLAWHAVFAEEAHRLKMEYICTVFLPCDAATLEPFVDRFKVASLEFESRSLTKALSEQLKPVIFSSGVCSGKYLWIVRLQDSLLHCTASYPCSPREVNLGAMKSQGFTCDGLSDHSGNVLTGGFAVMRGANIIEVHCRLNETPRENPDYPHSLNPNQLKQYIDNIQLAEVMLGDGKKKIEPSERALMQHRVRK